MATSCGYEFQAKHFRFVDSDESKFYEFQWTKKKIFFVLYRAFTFIYHWSWLIASWVFADSDITYTVSNWSFFFTGIYFMVAFFTSLYGIIKRRDYTEGSRRVADIESSQVTTVSNNTNAEAVPGQTSNDEEGNLRWFHKMTWFFHVIAMSFVIYVTVFFWALLAKDLSAEELRLPIGQHKHSVQGILLLIDMFLIAFPTHWIHVIYVTSLSFCYAIFLVIMHFAGVDSAAYGITDFQNNPNQAIIVLVLVVFVATPILHTITFALYHLRAAIYRCTVGKKTTDTKPAKFDKGHDNVVFTEE